MSLNPLNMKFLLKRKIPAGLSTETILAAHAVKSSGIPSFTLSFNEGWFPDGDPQVMARQCTQVSDLNALSETAIMIARPIATVPVEAP